MEKPPFNVMALSFVGKAEFSKGEGITIKPEAE
jgi:hypothetical protein